MWVSVSVSEEVGSCKAYTHNGMEFEVYILILAACMLDWYLKYSGRFQIWDCMFILEKKL